MKTVIRSGVMLLNFLTLPAGLLSAQPALGDVPLSCPFQAQGGINLSKSNNTIPTPPAQAGGVLPGTDWQWPNMGQPIPQCAGSSAACILNFVNLSFEWQSGSAIAAVCNYSVTQAGNPQFPSGGILVQLQQIPITGTLCGQKLKVTGLGPGATSSDPHYVCWRKNSKMIDCPTTLNQPAPPSPWTINGDDSNLGVTASSAHVGNTLVCSYPGGYTITQPIPPAGPAVSSGLAPPYTCQATATGFSCQ
jgi:hypothetical protein